MSYVDNQIIFLSTEGQVGFFDLKFYTWNFNIALRDVSFLLSLDWPHYNYRIEFHSGKPDIISYDSFGELSWSIEPTLFASLLPPVYTLGDILYKVIF